MKESKALQVINEMIVKIEAELREAREAIDADIPHASQYTIVAQHITKLNTELGMLNRLKERLEGA